MHGTPHEHTFIKEEVVVAWSIEFREATAVIVVNVLVHYAQTQHREGRVKQIVRRDKERVVHGLKGRQTNTHGKDGLVTLATLCNLSV